MNKDMMIKIDQLYPSLVELRRELHQKPELGFAEHNTRDTIITILNTLELPYEIIGNTGIKVVLNGQLGCNESTPTLCFRADMDALPIKEINDAPYRSLNTNIMHACGHDGHMAIVVGVLKILHAFRDKLCGKVVFLFQPAEESSGEGAKLMLEHGVLNNPTVDCIFGIHLWPELRVGEVGLNYDVAMGGTSNFTITINGQSGHAAKPNECLDAMVLAAYTITSFQMISSRFIDPLDPVVLTVGSVEGGYRHNIIAEEIKLNGTIRYLKKETLQLIQKKMRDILDGTIKIHSGGDYEISFQEGVSPLINDFNLTTKVSREASQLFGSKNVLTLKQPALTGEDFSSYLQHIPGCYIKLGCSSDTYNYSLHNSHFDFDEKVLKVGVKLLSSLAVNMLKKE